MVTVYYTLDTSDFSLVSWATWPIRDTDSGRTNLHYRQKDFDQTEVDAVLEGTKDFEYGDGDLFCVDSTRKQDMEDAIAAREAAMATELAEREVLRAKMEDGTATTDDIKDALERLLSVDI